MYVFWCERCNGFHDYEMLGGTEEKHYVARTKEWVVIAQFRCVVCGKTIWHERLRIKEVE